MFLLRYASRMDITLLQGYELILLNKNVSNDVSKSVLTTDWHFMATAVLIIWMHTFQSSYECNQFA